MKIKQNSLLAGLCLIAGGAYAFLWGAGHVIPAALLILGLLGLHARQATGRLGRLGLVTLIAGLAIGAALDLAGYLAPALLDSLGALPYVADGLVLSAGMVLYGLALTRAARFRGGELLVIGPLSTIILGSWGAQIGAAGYILLGYFLMTSKLGESPAAPATKPD